jgi:hypothetical protein
MTSIVVGDLVFFVDALLGKHDTCGWWCIYCLLKYPEWQVCDHTKPGKNKKWTEAKMNEYRDKVVKDMKEIQDRKDGTSTKKRDVK